MQYTFTLTYRLAQADAATGADTDAELDALIERLAEAGCDDALVGIGLPGCLGLDFTREAVSAQEALLSALADVKRALPDARLIEAVPDLVGLSDAATAVGVSRQNLRNLMLKHPASFPLPVHAGSTGVWHLEDLMLWLHECMDYALEPAALDIARTARQINLAREAGKLPPGLLKELRSLVT